MKFNEIVKYLETKFGDKISMTDGMDVVYVEVDIWGDVSKMLKDDNKLAFDYLMCISSYDKGDGKTYGVAYNFYSNVKSDADPDKIMVDPNAADAVVTPSLDRVVETKFDYNQAITKI